MITELFRDTGIYRAISKFDYRCQRAHHSGLGHFPMTENPDAFRGYLMPNLNELSQKLPKS